MSYSEHEFIFKTCDLVLDDVLSIILLLNSIRAVVGDMDWLTRKAFLIL